MKKHIGKLSDDFRSSIVVLLVALPLCLGIAVASGLDEFSGIIAGIVGGILVGVLSGSNLSVTGPAAGLTVIVFAAVAKLPSVEAFFLAVVLAGVLQLLMGVLKLGIIGEYIPNCVIKGMLAAIGIILILKQFPHLIGYDAGFEGDENFKQSSGENTFSALIHAFQSFTLTAVIIGFTGLAILIIYENKWIKKQSFSTYLSGPLLVVLAGIGINALAIYMNGNGLKSDHLVNIPMAGSLKGFVSFLRFPDWSFITRSDVWVTAITLAIVASLETLLGIEAVDKLDPLRRVTPPNRELMAQGAGNIVSGMLGGLPVTSVIVRSSANLDAGAKTKRSTIFHGIMILLFVVYLPHVLNMIPKAALASILIFTGYKLTKIPVFRDYYKKGWDQFIPFVVTIAAIVITDLLTGVLIGIATGIFYILRSNFRSAIFMVNKDKNYLLRLRKDVSFFSKPNLKFSLEKIPADSFLIIDITRAEFIDRDIIETLNDFMKHAHLKNITVEIKQSTYNSSSTEIQHPNDQKLKVQDDLAK